jgi:Domain of unknown function (DUF4349)
MSGNERHPMSELAGGELAVVDAALRGEAVAAEHAELAELALLLHDDRPRPRPQFIAALDREIQQRVSRRPARPSPHRAGPVRLRRRVGRHHLLAACAVMLIAAVAVGALALTAGRSHTTPRGTPLDAEAHSTPAVAHSTAAVARPATPASAGGRSGGIAANRPRPDVPAAQAASPARSVEHTATLQLGVPSGQIQSASQQVFSIASSFHGYVQQSSTTSGHEREGSASFQLRVPSASLPGALAAISQLGRVMSETNTTSDVTEQLGSLRRSLGDARAERTALLGQIARAEPEKLASLHARLGEVEARISNLQAQLGSLSSQVASTPISLTLSSEAPASPGSSGTLTPGGAVHDAGEILSTALAVLLIALAATLPLALAVALGWSALSSIRRRQREQALDSEPATTSA